MHISARGTRVYSEDSRENHRIFAEEVGSIVSWYYTRHNRDKSLEIWALVSKVIVDNTNALMIRHEAEYAEYPGGDNEEVYSTLITKKRRYARLTLNSAQKAIDHKVDVSKAVVSSAWDDVPSRIDTLRDEIRARQFRTTLRNYFYVANCLSDSKGKGLKTQLQTAIEEAGFDSK